MKQIFLRTFASLFKVALLILTSGPKKHVIPTEDAVKDLHDQGVIVVAVGVGNGQKEKLDDIVMFDENVVRANSVRALSSTSIIKKLAGFVIPGKVFKDVF